jgi:hypothetical protein
MKYTPFKQLGMMSLLCITKSIMRTTYSAMVSALFFLNMCSPHVHAGSFADAGRSEQAIKKLFNKALDEKTHASGNSKYLLWGHPLASGQYTLMEFEEASYRLNADEPSSPTEMEAKNGRKPSRFFEVMIGVVRYAQIVDAKLFLEFKMKEVVDEYGHVLVPNSDAAKARALRFLNGLTSPRKLNARAKMELRAAGVRGAQAWSEW